MMSIGLYSLKNCQNPFGKGFQSSSPPLTAKFHLSMQGCRTREILQSRIGEYGVSLENMGNMENMKKVENMEMVSGSPTDVFSRSPTLFTLFVHSIYSIYCYGSKNPNIRAWRT